MGMVNHLIEHKKLGVGFGKIYHAESYGMSTGATGAANVTALQAALDAANAAGGGHVSITVPGVYLYNATCTIYSNTRLTIGEGVVLRLTGGTRLPFLTNAARSATPQTVTSLTSSGSVVTLESTAHGYSVGDFISVAWAAESGFNGVFRVATVPTADTLTYYSDLIPEAATATVSAAASTFNPGVIQVRAADKNIYIDNHGLVDMDYLVNTGSTSNGLDQMCHVFGHGYNFEYGGGGGFANVAKYGVCYYAMRDFRVNGISGDAPSAVIQGTGPLHNCIIENITGFGADNIAAFGTGDYAAYHCSEGDIFRCEMRNITAKGSTLPPLRFFGSSKYKIIASLDGLYGSTVNAAGFQIINDVLVLPDGNARVEFLDVKRIDITTGTASPVSLAPASAVFMSVEDVRFQAGNGVSFGGSSAYTYETVKVKGVRMTNAVSGATAKNIVVGANAIINNLFVDDCEMLHNQKSTGRLLEIGGIVRRCVINRPVTYMGSALVNILTTLGAAAEITINAPLCYDTNFIYSNNGTQTLNASVVAGSIYNGAGIFRHAGASGTMNCRTSGVILSGGTTHITRTASQTLNAYGWEIGVDVDILATTAGQFCRNTDAASTAGIGVGLCTYQSAWTLI